MNIYNHFLESGDPLLSTQMPYNFATKKESHQRINGDVFRETLTRTIRSLLLIYVRHKGVDGTILRTPLS